MELWLTADAWKAGPILAAMGLRQRWRGLRPTPAGRSLLLSSKSVHTFGMRESLWMIGLSASGVVESIQLARPKRVVVFKSARFILELPSDHTPPALQAALTAHSR